MNILTGIISDLYRAADVVSRERIGAIMAVSRNTSMESAGQGQTIRVPITPAVSATDVSPSMTVPEGVNQTISYADVVIDKFKSVSIPWPAEQMVALQNGDMPTLADITSKQLIQGMRAISNEVEKDIADQYVYASRAYGSAGSTPFATADDLTDLSESVRILEENGAPTSDMHIVLNSAAIAKLRGKQSSLFKVNEAGTSALLRDGSIGVIEGVQVHQSAQIASHTAGTASSATTDDSGYDIGDTEITLDATGTGTILAGDCITFAGDTNKYIVASGDDDVSDGGSITLAAPGLRKAISASTTAITVVGTSARNIILSSNAIQLVARTSITPNPYGGPPGDVATDEDIVPDPVSGLPFRVAIYRGYNKIMTDVSLLYGVNTIKPEHFALLLG